MQVDGFLIRDYRPEDFQHIQELWNKTGVAYTGREDTNESILKTLKFEGKFFILEESKSGIIVGTIWVTCDGRRMHIHHMVVEPIYRGKGLGKFLAEVSVNYCKQMGYQARLDVEKINALSKHVFEELGFYSYTDYDIMVLRN